MGERAATHTRTNGVNPAVRSFDAISAVAYDDPDEQGARARRQDVDLGRLVRVHVGRHGLLLPR